MNVRPFDIVPQVSATLFILFPPIFFPLFRFNLFIYLSLSSPALSSVISILLSSPSSKFLNSVNVFFSPNMDIWFFPPLYFLFICWNFLSFHFFKWLFTLTFWSMVKIDALKSISDNSSIHVIFRLVSVYCLFPCQMLRFSGYLYVD